MVVLVVLVVLVVVVVAVVAVVALTSGSFRRTLLRKSEERKIFLPPFKPHTTSIEALKLIARSKYAEPSSPKPLSVTASSFKMELEDRASVGNDVSINH